MRVASLLAVAASLSLAAFLLIRVPEDPHKDLRDEIAKVSKAASSADVAIPLAQEAVETVTNQFGELNQKLSTIDSRLLNLEKQSGKETKTQEDGPAPGATGMDPIILPPELQEISRTTNHAGVMAEMEFEAVLDEFIEKGFLKFEARDKIPEEVTNRIRESFSAFKAKVSLARIQQRLYVETLIEECDRKGEHFTDLPASATQEDQRSAWAAVGRKKGGYNTVRTLKDGTNRHYHFSREEFPQVGEFQHQWTYAKDHMIRDIQTIVAKG